MEEELDRFWNFKKETYRKKCDEVKFDLAKNETMERDRVDRVCGNGNGEKNEDQKSKQAKMGIVKPNEEKSEKRTLG